VTPVAAAAPSSASPRHPSCRRRHGGDAVRAPRHRGGGTQRRRRRLAGREEGQARAHNGASLTDAVRGARLRRRARALRRRDLLRLPRRAPPRVRADPPATPKSRGCPPSQVNVLTFRLLS
jgi:hypothetical protein